MAAMILPDEGCETQPKLVFSKNFCRLFVNVLSEGSDDGGVDLDGALSSSDGSGEENSIGGHFLDAEIDHAAAAQRFLSEGRSPRDSGSDSEREDSVCGAQGTSCEATMEC